MRSTFTGVRLRWPILHAAQLRRKALGYGSFGKYVTYLILCDLIIRRGHDFTRWLDDQANETQDFVDDRLLDLETPAPHTQPSLSHYFCAGMIAVQRKRYGFETAEAVASLPAVIRSLCVAKGFA